MFSSWDFWGLETGEAFGDRGGVETSSTAETSNRPAVLTGLISSSLFAPLPKFAQFSSFFGVTGEPKGFSKGA